MRARIPAPFVDIDGAASPEVEIVRLSQRKVGEEDRHTDVFPTDGYESGRTHIVAKGEPSEGFRKQRRISLPRLVSRSTIVFGPKAPEDPFRLLRVDAKRPQIPEWKDE